VLLRSQDPNQRLFKSLNPLLSIGGCRGDDRLPTFNRLIKDPHIECGDGTDLMHLAARLIRVRLISLHEEPVTRVHDSHT
jgi:hypothetical protein